MGEGTQIDISACPNVLEFMQQNTNRKKGRKEDKSNTSSCKALHISCHV